MNTGATSGNCTFLLQMISQNQTLQIVDVNVDFGEKVVLDCPNLTKSKFSWYWNRAHLMDHDSGPLNRSFVINKKSLVIKNCTEKVAGTYTVSEDYEKISGCDFRVKCVLPVVIELSTSTEEPTIVDEQEKSDKNLNPDTTGKPRPKVALGKKRKNGETQSINSSITDNKSKENPYYVEYGIYESDEPYLIYRKRTNKGTTSSFCTPVLLTILISLFKPFLSSYVYLNNYSNIT